MNLIFFDDTLTENLYPLTFYRPAACLRSGILTTAERWNILLNLKGSFLTRDYLSLKYSSEIGDDNLLINGRALPNDALICAIQQLHPGECLMDNDLLVAARADRSTMQKKDVKAALADFKTFDAPDIPWITYGWDLFSHNDSCIRYDYSLITENRESEQLSDTNTMIGNGGIFLEKGAKAECAVFNTTNGPIYLGKDATVMEGSVIYGPFSLGDHSTLKVMSKIYGPVNIGPHCKVGGEVNNSVFQGFANKAHDGFLGQAVISEWCNLGADTNNSNLKNTYDIVKMWSYPDQRFIKTGLRFCGLLMGDHSKCGINTMFNTGTVVGVNCNIFGAGYQRNLIPSFSWGGGAKPHSHYSYEKNVQVATAVYKRRDLPFDDTEQKIMKAVYDLCQKQQNY